MIKNWLKRVLDIYELETALTQAYSQVKNLETRVELLERELKKQDQPEWKNILNGEPPQHMRPD